MEKKNLMDGPFRPIKSCLLGVVQFEDTKRAAIQMDLDGFTTMPCDDAEYEERSYLIPDSKLAFYIGWNLIRGGFRIAMMNMFKKGVN